MYTQLVHLVERVRALGFPRANACWSFEAQNKHMLSFVTGFKGTEVQIDARYKLSQASAQLLRACFTDPEDELTQTLLSMSDTYRHILDVPDSMTVPKRQWRIVPGVPNAFLDCALGSFVPTPSLPLTHLGIVDGDSSPRTLQQYGRLVMDIDGQQVTIGSSAYTRGSAKFTNVIVIQDSPDTQNIYRCERYILVGGTCGVAIAECTMLLPVDDQPDLMLREVHEFVRAQYNGSRPSFADHVCSKLLREQFCSFIPPEREPVQREKNYFNITSIRGDAWCISAVGADGQPSKLHVVRPYNYCPQDIYTV